MTVPDDVGAGEVRAAVREGGGKLLAAAEVFDVYRGEQLGAGRKSLALRLEFRAADRTLTDEEVAVVRERIKESVGAIGVSSVSETNVIVAGASGYAGALAAELVDRHPSLALRFATSRNHAGTRLRDLYPRYRSQVELTELDLGELEDVEAAIVAYPHGAAAPVVAGMRGLGLTVVDLSADFRLVDAAVYELWYAPHGEPELLENAVYGLTELNRDAIRGAGLVANPGCYPTAAILALAPLAERGLISSVVVDAKSGVSGAGRDGGERLSYVNLTESLAPYGLDGHRHLAGDQQ